MIMDSPINMTVQELIDMLNTYCIKNSICSVSEELYVEMEDLLKSINFEYVASVDHDEHRCYVLSEDVYKISIDGRTYYIGTWEVATLKSKSISVSDCRYYIEFFEMEPYTTVSYRRK